MKRYFAVLFAVLVGIGAASADPARPGSSQGSGILINSGQKVAFLGDSITAGGATHGRYCRLVIHGLKAKGVLVEPVMAGVSGNTSEDMLSRLEESVLRRRPDWVVLAAGVNDIWHGDPTVKIGVFQPEPGMGVKFDDYKKNVTEIVDRCSKAGANVILTTITPIREDPEFKLNLTSRKYNLFLVQLAKERKLPIAMLNEAMFAEIAKGVRLTSDGVHPLDVGHRVMAKGILRAMGLSEDDVDKLEEEWVSSPTVLILGDRQSTSGGRPGGWCNLLMDGMNSGREMATYTSFARYRGKIAVGDLLVGFKERAESKPRYVILQAPAWDALHETPLAEYRNQVEELIAVAEKNDVGPVFVTIPVQGNDVAHKLNLKLEPYNDLLRDVARAQRIPLADINRLMTERYQADPELTLTFDGERFSHQGAMLMAESLMRAMELESMITPRLRKTWAETPSYTNTR